MADWREQHACVAATVCALLAVASFCAALLRPSPPRVLLPPIDELAVDANTSLAALRRSFTCPPKPPLTPLRTKWLPAAPHSTRSGVTPFLVLHELHVGERWFVAMLRAARLSVSTAEKEKGVRDAARRWLGALATAASRKGARSAASAANSTAREAIGLALSPQALRILNHGVGAPKLPVGSAMPRAVQLITLSRRNRLKHAVSCHARSIRRSPTSLAGRARSSADAAASLSIPPTALTVRRTRQPGAHQAPPRTLVHCP